MNMENDTYDDQSLKDLSDDELLEELRQKEEKLELLKGLASRRGINLAQSSIPRFSPQSDEKIVNLLPYPVPNVAGIMTVRT